MKLEHPTQSSSTAIARLWNSPCPRYTLLTVIVSVAIACIIVGALAYSGAVWENMGTARAIALMGIGGSLLGIVILVNCLINPPSFQKHIADGPMGAYYLRDGEFFVYEGFKGKMVCAKGPGLPPIGEHQLYKEYYPQYSTDTNYREVSTRELADRSGNPIT